MNMDSKQWNLIRQQTDKAKKMLSALHMSPAYLKVSWSDLSEDEQSKISKWIAKNGSGWFERAEPIPTPAGIKKVAPKHRKAALKKKSMVVMRKPMKKEKGVHTVTKEEKATPISASVLSDLQKTAKKLYDIEGNYTGRERHVIFAELAKRGYRVISDPANDRYGITADMIKTYAMVDIQQIELEFRNRTRVLWIGKPTNKAGEEELYRLKNDKLPAISLKRDELPEDVREEYVESKWKTYQDSERKGEGYFVDDFELEWNIDSKSEDAVPIETYVEGKRVKVKAYKPAILKEDLERLSGEMKKRKHTGKTDDFLHSKIHDMINSPSFETRGRLGLVIKILGYNPETFFNNPNIYTDEQLQAVLERMQVEPTVKEAETQKTVKKEKTRTPRTPEIEWTTERKTIKKTVRRELTGLSTDVSRRLAKEHAWQYARRTKTPDGSYIVSWDEVVEEDLPVEGLVIRGLAKEQAEDIKNILKERVKSIKAEISMRKGAGDKYELYTQIPLNPTAVKGVLREYHKHFAGKRERGEGKEEKKETPQPLMIKYRHGGSSPVTIPIEQLDEEIKKHTELDVEQTKKTDAETYKNIVEQAEKVAPYTQG